MNGTGEEVSATLGDLAARGGADESPVSLHSPDEERRLYSFRRFAEPHIPARGGAARADKARCGRRPVRRAS